jgi:acetyl-CoA C-acetyltransferase
MTNIVIASAARTPVGSFSGAFANTPAHDLGSAVLEELVARAGIDKSEVSETILGQVLTAGQGQNPARQAHVNAGLPIESPAWSINQVCGSGLRAVALAAQHITLGDADIIAAGGQESMSLSPHVAHLRAGTKMGDVKYIDSMIRDGLWDAFNGYHMGQTAENVAEKWQITREQQDEFAVASQNKAEEAQKAGRLDDEIVPFTVKTRKGETVVDQDEYIRYGATLEAMQKLRPAFTKDGTVTAANASSISDGASALVLARESVARERGLQPLARLLGHATNSRHPSEFTVAPIGATEKLLKQVGWRVTDVDLFEINEAFAMVAMMPMLDLGIPHDKLNIHGGACALGHPIGSTGSRIILTLIHALKRTGGKRGIASLCIGGGEATAVAVELL